MLLRRPLLQVIFLSCVIVVLLLNNFAQPVAARYCSKAHAD
jgi:hypothetical protein